MENNSKEAKPTEEYARELRAKSNQRQVDRYANDPEYRARRKQQSLEAYQRRKARYEAARNGEATEPPRPHKLSDEERVKRYREKRNEQCRKYYHRKREEFKKLQEQNNNN